MNTIELLDALQLKAKERPGTSKKHSLQPAVRINPVDALL